MRGVRGVTIGSDISRNQQQQQARTPKSTERKSVSGVSMSGIESFGEGGSIGGKLEGAGIGKVAGGSFRGFECAEVLQVLHLSSGALKSVLEEFVGYANKKLRLRR